MHPKFIALAGSPIPYMNGTDFPALAQVLEEETGIPAFAVPTNGMHDYVYGAGIALEEIAKRFTGEKDRTDSDTHRQSAWCDTTGLWTGISCRGAEREPESLWMEGAVYLGNGR